MVNTSHYHPAFILSTTKPHFRALDQRQLFNLDHTQIDPHKVVEAGKISLHGNMHAEGASNLRVLCLPDQDVNCWVTMTPIHKNQGIAFIHNLSNTFFRKSGLQSDKAGGLP